MVSSHVVTVTRVTLPFPPSMSRAKVESRNNFETYLYNLKASYEDTLKDKIAGNDLEGLKTCVDDGLEV